jgi:two-component system response regulator AtoC
MKPRIMIIEDDEIMRVTVEDSLKADGYETSAFDNGTEGIRSLEKNEFALVITDVRLPDMSGIDVLRVIKEINKDIPVLVMTGFGAIKDAVEAMKLGAFDYLTKPFSLEEFALIVKKIIEVKKHRDKDTMLKLEMPLCQGCAQIIGNSDEIREVFKLINKIARTDSTVLVLGENGTGKELVSTSIHCSSHRKKEPLIKINCSAIPENLIESELFGYEPGAFTGATRRKLGRFELANKGSIFLDEIGDLPASSQVKLLGVLQDGALERLGGTDTIKVDVRIIAATNRDLWADVKSGRFREDLYYRLNVIPIKMPSLRVRREDIPLLVEHFLENFNKSFDRSAVMSSDALRALMEYDYPGNVRELENIVERCIALSSDDTLTEETLPSYIVKHKKEVSYSTILAEVAAEAERSHIMKILKSTRSNKTKAAEILGISRKTLWEKMKIYEIE